MMTIDEKIAVLQAYKNGKKIEKIPILKPDSVTLKWADFDAEIQDFDFSKYEYRIKPKFKVGDKVTLIGRAKQPFTINGMYFNKKYNNWLYYYDGSGQEVINESRLEAYDMYRPFLNDNEAVLAIIKHGTLLKYNKEGGTFVALSKVYSTGIMVVDDERLLYFYDAMANYTFADGTPFGVKLSEGE